MNKKSFTFLADSGSSIFFDMPENTSAKISVSRPIDIIWSNEERQISDSDAIHADTAGIYCVSLFPDNGERLTVTAAYDDGVMPFLMCGQGVVWQHGSVFPLLFEQGAEQSVWTIRDPAFDLHTVVVKGVPLDENIHISAPDGSQLTSDWYPKLGRPWFWHSSELHDSYPWLRFDFRSDENDIRFAMTNTSIFSLVEPERDFRTGKLRLAATNERSERIDARYELFVRQERVAMYDILRDEDICVTLPRGRYRLRVSSGFTKSVFVDEVSIGEGVSAPSVVLHETMRLPKGWAFGELHMHSSFEDATLYPEQVMRAARANGKNFCFQTDKDVDKLLKYGTSMHDAEGHFIGLPGQEIMCHELHMNILNTDRQIYNPEADNLSAVNTDITEKIPKWLAEIKEMRGRIPCTFMLNHPFHRPSTMKGSAYFRSWWVADVYEDFGLTENCDFERWYDRLNRGRWINAALTTDSHDASLVYPGRSGVCVYVGDTLSAESIISAIDAGRFFSVNEPGAFLDIRVENGKVVIDAAAPVPIKTIELISMGSVAKKFTVDGKDSRIETDVPRGSKWVAARMILDDSEYSRGDHYELPFMCAGYHAFTNAVRGN